MAENAERKRSRFSDTAGEDDVPTTKKNRWDSEEPSIPSGFSAAPPPPPPSAFSAAPPPPPPPVHDFEAASGTGAMTNDAMDKAKQAMAISKQIQEQIRNMQLFTGAQGQAGSQTFKPAPLLLDDKGRQIDESGKVIENKKESLATIKANIRTKKVTLKVSAAPKLIQDNDKNPHYDPRMRVKNVDRKKRKWSFVEAGKFIKQAENARAKAAEKEFSKGYEGKSSLPLPLGPLFDEQKVNMARKKALLDIVPDCEWWDIGLLTQKSYRDLHMTDQFANEQRINFAKIKHLVEHPVLIHAPLEKFEDVQMPLFLTKQEKKRLRKRNRFEAEKEKQDKIRLGLMPAPPPKVKMSNLMRVLGSTAVSDPSKMEAEVRKAATERRREHEERNEQRKLTPEEKREKLKAKIAADKSTEVQVALFKVTYMSKQNKWKIDMNAQQLFLSGIALLNDEMNLVVAEGGSKMIKKFIRLMEHRLDWNKVEDDEAEGEDSEEETEKKPDVKKCDLVWKGVTKSAAFKSFKFESSKTETAARKFLQQRGVGHYWDMCKNHGTCVV